MSWTNELLEVYNRALEIKHEPGQPRLLPVSHTTAKANIEITITEDGELVTDGVSVVGDDAYTIVPDSGKAKVGKYPPPYPLNETIRYLAGDFNEYISENIKGNERNHKDYLTQLAEWKDSEYSHKALKAIYSYVTKDTLVYDCIQSGALEVDDKTGKLKDKQFGIPVDKCFVRFLVQYSDMSYKKQETWKDVTLFNCFSNYLNSNVKEKQLCYATGKELQATYTHPYGIVKSNARAKYLSSNDTSNYTFRGRFSTKEEAVSVSYEYSQKMHNALKWLIERELVTRSDGKGKTITFNPMAFDSLTLIVWNSALKFVPSVIESAFEVIEEEYSSVPEFSKMIHKKLMGGKAEFKPDSKVMIMGLDAATTGRLSIAMYTELSESQFAANLEKWHKDTVWWRFKEPLI